MIDAVDALTELQRVAVLALRLRALDARSTAPILNDQTSLRVAHALGMDLDEPRIPRSVVAVHAVRTKTLDSIVTRFVADYPTAAVLDLGCGLDPRQQRCAPPAGVTWYDVDYPAIVSLRDQLLPRAGHPIGVEIGAADWLADVPTDRPAVVVTDGLLALMSGGAFQDMTRDVTAHLRRGQFAFNAHSRLAMRNSRRMRSGPLSMPTAGDGIDDPREPESWNARLSLLDQRPMAHEPDVATFPPLLRAVTRLGARSDRVLRHSDRVVRYRFENSAGQPDAPPRSPPRSG